MRRDPIRRRIHDPLRKNDLTMREAARALGRNPAYVRRFLERGSPRVLGYRDGEKLAAMLGRDPGELLHPAAPRRKPRAAVPRVPGAPVVGISEMAVQVAAGGGALNDEAAAETARGYLPEAALRHEGGAEPANLRILRARGDSMEPAIHDGDRLLVDTGRKTPATGEMAILWDGGGLVVKRVEAIPRADPPRLRLISANPACQPHDRLAGEAHIAGTVLWALSRV